MSRKLFFTFIFFITFLFFNSYSIARIKTVIFSNNLTQGIPKITGEWKVGKTLSVDLSNLTDADGIGQFEYQWLRDEAEISSETSSTYYLLLSDLKKSISVSLKHTDLLGNVDTLYTPLFGAWGEYQYLSDEIKMTQAAVVRITASTAVMISPTHAITAAHSPLDENNEITPNLTVQNIFLEKRDIIDVKYDTLADFAIVELESPFENSYAVEIAPNKPSAGDAAFAVGNPKDVAWGAVGWAVSFGFARDIEYEEYFNLFDIQIMGGFSGGGIFNDKGQLQGIISGGNSTGSDQSFRPNNSVNEGTIFSEDFDLYDGPWKSLDRLQVRAVSLKFINDFLTLHQVTNIKNTENINLPENKKDYYFDSLTDEEESYLESIAGPLRKSVVAYSDNGIGVGNSPNGSGVLITDRIVATNSHVVEGKEYFKLTLYDGTEISGSVLDHHPETDVSLILLDEPVSSNISPVSFAESRPVLDDLGFLIGHPFDLWNTKGAWQVSGAVSGYGRAEIDDRGDLLIAGGGSSGMSGGPIFNSNGKLIGINYASGSSIALELKDYQDPHSTYYNPIVSPELIQHVAVDVSGIRDLIDENSIFVSEHASPSSAFEIEYFSSSSGKVYSAEKINNTTPSVKIKEIQSKNFNELVDISLPIDTNNKWSVINFLNNENDDYFSINTYLENGSVGVSVTKLKDNFELDNSFGSGGHVSQLFTNTSIQKIIKSSIYDNKLYLLTQNSKNQQISFSVYTLDLNNPQNFVSLFELTSEFSTSSNYFSKDFIVNSDGVFVGGTTDDSDPSVGFGARTYDHFVSHFFLNGSINSDFANNGVFQKDFGDTDKATALAIQSDGKILIAGMNWLDLAPDAVATRLNIDGSIDTSFGDNGTTPVTRFLTSENHKSMRDLGREVATDILIDNSGNVFIGGSRYFGKVNVDYGDKGMLTANNGNYEAAIWKYDSAGNIVNDFGTYDYENGALEGIRMIKLMGNNKVTKLLNVNNQLLAFVASRTNITKNTSNQVFLIDDISGEIEIFASNSPTIYIPNPLQTDEDNSLQNIKIESWEGSDFSYSFSSPNKASIIDNGDNTFNFIPNQNENGSDSFIVTLDVDDTTITKTIDVLISPQDDLPDLLSGNGYEINEDTSSITLTIRDIDSPIISYSLGAPENGSLKDNEDFTFTYTPNENFNGNDNFEISVISMRDLHEERTSIIPVYININAVNDPPTAEDVSLVTKLNTDGTEEFDGSDIDGDNLTYSVITGPENGSVNIDNNKFIYTPNNNYVGSDEFFYAASDGLLNSNEAKVSIVIEDVDSDSDGVSDRFDQCTDTPNGEAVDANGCSDSQKDTDGDGVTDDIDECPDTLIGENVDIKGCPLPLFVENISFVKKVYPNPTDNEFIVELKDNSKVEKVEFVDFSGKIITPNKVEISKSSIRINVSNIIEGIYLLYITTDKEVNKVKVVIER